MKKNFIIIGCFFCIILGRELYGQTSPRFYRSLYHGEPWHTINTAHFLIHYQQGNKQSAKLVSTIAEHIYQPITELYHYKPKKKTNIILNDRQDYSNGAAYFYDNIIEIWLPTLNTPLRGQHQWLHNVISHEFTHIVQIQSSMARSPSVPFIYLQWISYEKIKRRDQQLGFPKGVISYPLSSVDIPAWWAEGTAQFQREQLHFDRWDSHRDMLLRTHILESKSISFNNMSHFSSKSSVQRELVYNQGWAFVRYLVYKFGEDIIPKINNQLKKNTISNVSQAINKSTNKKVSHLFNEWKLVLYQHYNAMAEARENTNIKTSLLTKKGSLNLYPAYRGQYLAYLTNSGSNGNLLSLHIEDTNSTKHQSLQLDSPTPLSPISSNSFPLRQQPYYYQCSILNSNIGKAYYAPFSFSHDQKKVAFSQTRRNRKGETYNFIYIYNIPTQKLQAITNSTRMRSPIFTSSDTAIVGIQPQDGTDNIVSINIKNGQKKRLSNFNGDYQIYKLVWGESQETLILDMAIEGQRHIFQYNLKSKELQDLFSDDYHHDYRDPSFDSQQEYLYYSSNRRGGFNIYRSKKPYTDQEQITDVIGGAFMPDISHDQTLIYSEFSHKGYHLMKIKKIEPITNPSPVYTPPDFLNDAGKQPVFFFDKIDTLKAKLYPYKAQNTSFSFSPIILFDNYIYRYGSNSKLFARGRYEQVIGNFLRNIKFGTAFFSYEVLPRLVISGSFAIAPLTAIPTDVGNFFTPSHWLGADRDLRARIEYGLPWGSSYSSPILEFEVLNVQRLIDDAATIEEFPCTSCLPDTLLVDATFNGWRIGLSLRSKLSPLQLLTLHGYFNSYTSEVHSFFSNEIKQLIPKTSTNYFRSYSIGFDYDIEGYKPYRHQFIAPQGFRGFFRYIYEPSSLLDRYILNQDGEEATIQPMYIKNNNHSIELRFRYGIPISSKLTADLETRGFTYLNNPTDDFYHDYIGGVLFLRSYPFYSIGGNTTFFSRLSLSFPLWTNINAQFQHILLDKIFLRLYGETGTAWRSTLLERNTLKVGIGAELRMALVSNHFLPTQLFVSTSYGFSTFNITLSDDFDTDLGSQSVSYGNDVLFHFGILFNFDFF